MSLEDAAKPVRREFPLVLLDEKGAELDAQAVAHDVTEKGFKAQSRVELSPKQVVRFRLSLDAVNEVTGRGRVDWCQRNDLAFWSGVQFVGLTSGDRQRVRRTVNPGAADWNAIADKAIFALLLALATSLGWCAMTSALWRGLLTQMLPKILACVAMGLALRVLLSC